MPELALGTVTLESSESMASPHPVPEAVRAYCNQNNYSDPVRQDDHWWAFPAHGNQLVPLPSMARLGEAKMFDITTIAAFLFVAFLGLLDVLNGAGALDIVRIQSITIAYATYASLRFTFAGKVKKAITAALALAFFAVAALAELKPLDLLLIHALSGVIGGLAIDLARQQYWKSRS